MNQPPDFRPLVLLVALLLACGIALVVVGTALHHLFIR